MTLVGKIFTVLIFVMSIVFMSFAVMVFATHKNWKEYADNASPGPGQKLGLKQQYEQLEQLKKQADAQLTASKNELAEEQAARKQALGALQSQLSQALSKLAAQQTEYDRLLADNTTATQTAKEAQARLAALEAENMARREELRTVQKDLDDKFSQVVTLTDQLNQAESLKAILDERNREAAFQMAQMKMVMDRNGLTVDSLVSHIPPKVDAVVLEVSDKDLIEVSIGSDDGIKEGHSMEIYRGNTYLGRIVIRRTTGDRAVGQLIKELQRGQIKRGDRVTTKFS
jgi:multidrug efflux pump subunit AcrA (membrane-fusion protein)